MTAPEPDPATASSPGLASEPAPRHDPGIVGPRPCGGDSCGCRWEFFAEGLYFRPGNAEVTYAVPINGPIVPPPTPAVEAGRVGMTDPEYRMGFRLGFAAAVDPCSSVDVTYTYFDGRYVDSIAATAPGTVLDPIAAHPETFNAATTFLSANAFQDIGFQLVDIDYRHTFYRDDCTTLSYLGGFRYGHLQQSFTATYNHEIKDSVSSRTSFDGLGIRLGLEGERRLGQCGWLIYGKSRRQLHRRRIRGGL